MGRDSGGPPPDRHKFNATPSYLGEGGILYIADLSDCLDFREIQGAGSRRLAGPPAGRFIGDWGELQRFGGYVLPFCVYYWFQRLALGPPALPPQRGKSLLTRWFWPPRYAVVSLVLVCAGRFWCRFRRHRGCCGFVSLNLFCSRRRFLRWFCLFFLYRVCRLRLALVFSRGRKKCGGGKSGAGFRSF